MPAGLITSSPRKSYSGKLPKKFLVAGSVFGDVSLRNEIGPWTVTSYHLRYDTFSIITNLYSVL